MPTPTFDAAGDLTLGVGEPGVASLALARILAVRMLPLVSITTANQRVVGQNPNRQGIGFAAPAAWPATARVSPTANTPSGFGIALTAGSIVWLEVGTFGALVLSEWWAIGASGQSVLIYESYIP